MSKKLSMHTLINFFISLLITIFFIVTLMMFIIKKEFIAPIIIFSIFVTFNIFLDIHYYIIYKCSKNDDLIIENKYPKVQIANMVLLVLFGVLSFSIWLVLFVWILFFEFILIPYICVLFIALLCLNYTINLALINKLFMKKKRNHFYY